MNAGPIDEFSIALSPVLFGSGIRLFEDGRGPTQVVTHLTHIFGELGAANRTDATARARELGLLQ